MCFIFQVQKWREKQLEVLEVRRNLEESKHHAELEKIQQENERLLKHRQQLKEKVRSFPILLFFFIILSLAYGLLHKKRTTSIS